MNKYLKISPEVQFPRYALSAKRANGGNGGKHHS